MVREVLPRLLALLPAAEAAALRFHVVGSNPAPPRLLRLFGRSAAHVTFHGFLSDDEVRGCGECGAWWECKAGR